MRPTPVALHARAFVPGARKLGTAVAALAALLLLLAGLGCSRHAAANFQTDDITDHLPDLKFNLATPGNAHLTAKDFRGKIVLLYFGYTHCPDVCPMTLSRLVSILHGLGPDASKMKLLFVSVDPKRDTPDLVQTYVNAFSRDAVGATGTPAEIEAVAKRYRVAYQAEQPTNEGSYEVMHSKAVYVFDQDGHARLLMTDTDNPKAITHDLHELAASS